MRIIEVPCCEKCPYFKQTNGFYRVWVCRNVSFQSPNINNKFKKDGSYPKFANKRVAAGCPLSKLTFKGVKNEYSS